ncbi:MAG: hypothetical protein ABL999_18245 [Pyrinomonadaceae bacterium]
MKFRGNLRVTALCTILTTMAMPSIFAAPVLAQTQTQEGVALQRGYRTGYSDGYMSGYRDTIDSVSKNFGRHNDYTKADRAYSKDYGTIEDYRDGYQQGFESGYETGYERRSFESSLPTSLRKRGTLYINNSQLAQNEPANVKTIRNTAPVQTSNAGYSENTQQQPAYQQPAKVEQVATNYQSNSTPIIIIPRDTELILELQEDISTERSREGEKFTARIVSPSEIAGAMVEGRVSKVLKPGRIKRRSELSLTFDRIILDDNRWSNFGATLTEVLAVKGDNVKKVDLEGTALGQSSLKNDAIKVGGATGAGALIGGVVGGPIGVAVGAGVGAAFGVGAVVIERGKHIKLTRNQQLRIKTAYQTQIR